ncbi:MAG: hypothetical protein NWQ98_03565, partial [Schleiferiaceae bacterium]|nr:hypothetical protein [Schleiferiaceae bacterium]MDP5014731.1 hypothetical protein [Schleiferiaceae bacterium]
FEPATSGTTIRRSNQLSYNHHVWGGKYSVPNWFCKGYKGGATGQFIAFKHVGNTIVYEIPPNFDP